MTSDNECGNDCGRGNAAQSPTLPEFWDFLRAHDFTWIYADDRATYEAGRRRASHIENMSRRGPEWSALADAFWRGETPPRPDEPTTTDTERT